MLRAPGDLADFAARAAPGDKAAYGRGARPPAELVRAMRPLVEAGVLQPLAKREGREFLFLVQRGAARFESATGRLSRGRARQRMVRRSSLSLVLGLLRAAALAGRTCPTNEQIARACGLAGREAARYRLTLLVRQGKIAIEDRGPGHPRVVTLLIGRHAGLSTRREE